MELVGAILKNERSKKKLDLVKISNELNISYETLKSIEDNDFPEYISTVFLIGHIRSYAKALGLNQNLIIENFKVQTSYNNLNLKKEISKPVKVNSFISIPKTLSFVSIIFLFSGFYFLFIQSNNSNSKYAITPNVPENLTYDLEAIEMELSINKEKVLRKINNNKIIINEINNLTNSSSAIASLPNKKDLNNLDKYIALKFINPTWIQIKDSEENIILSKLMTNGDEYNYNLSDNFSLTAGNAGNIVISLDGIVKGKLGKFGEVVDSLIIDSNFSN